MITPGDLLAEMLREMLSDPDGPAPERYLADPGDPGLFGPGSAVWTVHADLSMLVGGVRALLLQTLHPLAMAGVADHSEYRRDPLGRLRRTATFVGVTTFGSTPMVEEAVAVVRAVHRRVVGVAPDGRHYSADDPELLVWVHAAEAQSFLIAHKHFGRTRLGRAGVDEYLDSAAEVPIRLGADPELVPRSWRELERYFERVRPELHAGAQARSAVRWLLTPPLPVAARAPYAVLAAAAIGTLPWWARRRLWLPGVPFVDPLVVRPAVATLLRTAGWLLPESPVLSAATARSVERSGGGVDA